MVIFASMDKAGAEAYLAQFMAEMDDRIEALKRESAETWGPTAEALDRSIDSLQPLWEWIARRAAWRTGYVPAPPGDAQPLVDLAVVEPLAELPSWFEDAPQFGAPFSTPTLWLIDGFGRYFGECLVHSIDRARWRIGRSRVKNYVFQNRPVVGNLKAVGEMEPIRTTLGCVRQQLDVGTGRTPLDLATRWVAAER